MYFDFVRINRDLQVVQINSFSFKIFKYDAISYSRNLLKTRY